MSNAPFSDSIDPQDLKTFQTYVEVQAMAVASIRKENTRLKIEVEHVRKENDELQRENDGLKKQNFNLTEDRRIEDWMRWAQRPNVTKYANMTVSEIYADLAKNRKNDSFISDAALKRIDEHSARLDKLEKKGEHEYEGSERWSPELGDEVYRDGKWVTITESKHPDDDQMVHDAKQYYNMDSKTWLGLSKIAQVALLQHYNKED